LQEPATKKPVLGVSSHASIHFTNTTLAGDLQAAFRNACAAGLSCITSRFVVTFITSAVEHAVGNFCAGYLPTLDERQWWKWMAKPQRFSQQSKPLNFSVLVREASERLFACEKLNSCESASAQWFGEIGFNIFSIIVRRDNAPTKLRCQAPVSRKAGMLLYRLD
jgi:hypothetical protein